jgi:hypothetical protein
LGVAKTPTKKGTTVTNKYQKNMPKTSTGPGLAVPDEVTIAMGEIAEDMREGLLALAVGAGLQVMASLMEADVAAACGPRGRHDPGRTAVRHGSERGSVTLGGRRVGVTRPRMRATSAVTLTTSRWWLGVGRCRSPRWETWVTCCSIR